MKPYATFSPKLTDSQIAEIVQSLELDWDEGQLKASRIRWVENATAMIMVEIILTNSLRMPKIEVLTDVETSDRQTLIQLNNICKEIDAAIEETKRITLAKLQTAIDQAVLLERQFKAIKQNHAEMSLEQKRSTYQKFNQSQVELGRKKSELIELMKQAIATGICESD